MLVAHDTLMMEVNAIYCLLAQDWCIIGYSYVVANELQGPGLRGKVCQGEFFMKQVVLNDV